MNLSKLRDLFRAKPKEAEDVLKESEKQKRKAEVVRKRATREIQKKRAQTDTAFEEVEQTTCAITKHESKDCDCSSVLEQPAGPATVPPQESSR